MTQEEKIEKALNILSLLYNKDVSPPEGIIVRIERGLNNHLAHHQHWSGKVFNVVLIVFQCILMLMIALLIQKIKGL